MKQNLTKGFLSIFFVALSFLVHAQGGVSINKTNTPADPSAILDVSSTSSPYLGMLIPRMSTANRNTISNPAVGLQIFNTDCGINEYYTGSCWITMGQVLKRPDQITCSGTTDVCSNDTRTFSITAVTGATGYVWTVPSGASITSGQGTILVTVQFGSHSGEVCVHATNVCEASSSTCIDVYANPAAASPGNISGSADVCAASAGNVYSVSAVAGASSYTWSVPAGATITAGQGTTSITVTFGSASGNVSVVAANSCGSSSALNYAVTVNAGIPAQPGAITGITTNLAGSVSSFSISPVASATSYTWTVPSNSTITWGQGTSTIYVYYLCSASGNVSVIANNGCGSGTHRTQEVNPGLVSPSQITGAVYVVPNGTGYVYSITPIPFASYNWSVPAGATITAGQNTPSITVDFGSSPTGNVAVAVSTSICGSNGTRTFGVIGAISPLTILYTGTAQDFTIPSGVTSITMDVYGGQGGNDYGGDGGKGGQAKGTLAVTPGQVLHLYVGKYASNGFNGGGQSNLRGGDASDVRTGGTALSNRVIVAGGGGGSGYQGSCCVFGGAGGGLTGGTGGNASGCVGGTGGSQSAGGTGGNGVTGNGQPGTLGLGGDGGGFGGGGGGGYYGGGGSGNNDNNSFGGGGGGGSNYFSPSLTNTTNNQGVQSSDGKIILSW